MIKRKIIFSIIAFIIIEGLSILNIELSHKKELDLYYSVQTEGLELNQKAAQNAYLLMTENVFNHLISNEKILQIFSQANTDDSLRRSEMRIRLYDELAHTFGYLKSSEINHLHFYLPNNKSFLRFHRSDKFDDDLSLTRYSVKLVNETKQKQIGFEIGTNHSAFRYVFPLFYKNEYIGSVETGFSFKSIMDQLKVHQNIVYGFMLKKEFISNTNAKYIQNLLSENYVEEEQFLHYLEDSLSILKQIDKSISNEIASQVAETKNFTVSCKIDGNYYLVSFVSINSIEGKPVAYLFSYKEDNVITEYKRQYYIVHISSFISFFLLILLFYLISRKTGRIKEKDEDYKALINANTDIVFIVSRENELLYLNKQVESTLGYKPESLVGENFTQFIVQSEIPILLEKVKGLFSERQTSHFYTQIIHKSGRFIDAEINLRVIKYNRKLVGVCTLKDITERKKSELALKTSDERYKEVEKIAQLGHWDFDIISNKLYWSDQIYRIFDIEPQEFGGTYEAFLGEIHPDDRERVNLSYRSSLANKLPYEVEHRILLKNGELRHVVEKCRTEYDKLGRAVRSIGMVIDITERKNAEQALIESEKKFSEIFKNSPIAFSLSTVSDGRFFEINDSFTTIFGFTELEVKGKTSADLNIWLNSENRSEGVGLLGKDGFVRNLEVQIRTKSGEIKDILLSGLIIEISGKSMLASHFMDITAKKNVELALKESEETLRFIFENSPNLYYSHSPNHVLNYVSPQVFKLLGYTEEESLINWTNFTTNNPINELGYQHTMRAIKTGNVQEPFELELRRKDGKIIRVEAREAPVLENGKTISIVGALTDITERKEADLALIESEGNFRLLFENSPLGTYIANPDGSIIDANKALLAMLDSPSIEATKQINVLKYPPLTKVGYTEKFNKCVETGEISTMEILYTSNWGKSAFYSSYIIPLKNSKGKVVKVYTIMEDISSRKETEKALIETDKQLRLSNQSLLEERNIFMIGNVVIFKWMYQSGWRVEYVSQNVSNVFGYSVDDFVSGKITYNELIHRDDIERVGKELKNGVNNKLNYFNHKEYRIINKSGKIVWLYDFTTILRDKDNKITHFYGYVMDVTKRKEMEFALRKSEAKLIESNKTKDKFFSIIAHDLKSPFNTLLGFSELLLNNHKEYDEEKRERLIKLMNQSSVNSFNLLEDLLTWAHSQSGKLEFLAEKLDVFDLISSNVFLIRGTAKSKNIKLISNVETRAFVCADKNMIETILRNLINNAIKFTPKNGKIIVSARAIKNLNVIEITVSDNGIGISKDKIDDLFKLDKSSSTIGTENETGTGLGLILCKEFVEKNEGKIWVESEPNVGSNFKFTLPISCKS